MSWSWFLCIIRPFCMLTLWGDNLKLLKWLNSTLPHRPFLLTPPGLLSLAVPVLCFAPSVWGWIPQDWTFFAATTSNFQNLNLAKSQKHDQIEVCCACVSLSAVKLFLIEEFRERLIKFPSLSAPNVLSVQNEYIRSLIEVSELVVWKSCSGWTFETFPDSNCESNTLPIPICENNNNCRVWI